QKETIRLSKLVNDLADLNYIEEDLYSIDGQPIALAQLLYDAIDLFKIHLDEKDLHLDLNINEELIIIGDADRIHQVFYNTLDNAIKYSLIGGTISIRLGKSEQKVIFSINNKGMTIHKDDLKRIGERFFRTDKARNRTTGGTGLGLSIVKEIVRLHGGTFSINSNQAQGTSVTIQLPHLD